MQVAGIPVLHPRDHDPAPVGCKDSLFRVEIHSVIHTLISLRYKPACLRVIVSDQAESPIAVMIFQPVRQHIHRACQDHLFAVQFKEIRAFPHSPEAVTVNGKLSLKFPVVRILCREEQDLSALLFFVDHCSGQKTVRIIRIAVMQHFFLFAQGIAHASSFKCSVFLLPDTRIPEVVFTALFRQVLKDKNRIAVVFGIVFPISESDTLCLYFQIPLAHLQFFAYAGVHEHMRAILHRQGTAGKASVPVIRHIRRQCGRQVFPVQKVLAHCVSPVHRSPMRVVRVVLVEEMVLPFIY